MKWKLFFDHILKFDLINKLFVYKIESTNKIKFKKRWRRRKAAKRMWESKTKHWNAYEIYVFTFTQSDMSRSLASESVPIQTVWTVSGKASPKVYGKKWKKEKKRYRNREFDAGSLCFG